MKHILLYILATATLLSCGSDTKPAEQITAPAINFKTNSVPVPFAGNWISETYLSDIKEHQSPRKAQENIEECYIQLPDNTLRPSTMVINFHEGISDLVTVNNNGVFQLWEKQVTLLKSMINFLLKSAPHRLAMNPGYWKKYYSKEHTSPKKASISNLSPTAK